MKTVALALLLGATGSHASKVFEKADAMRVMEKMQSMAKSNSIDGKDAIREAAGYLKRKEALPQEVKDRLSRRADYDPFFPACMDSCDMNIQDADDMEAFCSSKCWESCPSCYGGYYDAVCGADDYQLDYSYDITCENCVDSSAPAEGWSYFFENVDYSNNYDTCEEFYADVPLKCCNSEVQAYMRADGCASYSFSYGEVLELLPDGHWEFYDNSCSGGGGDDDDDICFSADSTVQLESGATKTMAELKVGDKILSSDAAGKLSYSEVAFLPHGPNTKRADFVAVTTEFGKVVKATPTHLLKGCDGSLVQAKSASCLRTVDGDEAVASIKTFESRGVYSAVTLDNEYLVVDAVVASPFAMAHGFVNTYYGLHRAIYKLSPSLMKLPSIVSANSLLAAGVLMAMNALSVSEK
jgi:hypothetical protein